MRRKPVILAVVAVLGGVILVGVYLFSPGRKTEPLRLAPNVGLPLLLEGRPSPPLEVEVDQEEILRIFPRRVTSVLPPSPPTTDERDSQRSDQDALEEITARWVYVGHLNLTGVPVGTFRYNDRPKTDNGFQVRQGDIHEGVTVYYLDSSKAMARYGSATVRLPLISARELTVEERTRMVAATEGVPDPTQAWLFYWEWFGKKKKQESKDYVPAPGEFFPPKEVTKQELKDRIDHYLELIDERVRARKPHPKYDQTGISLDDIRKELYARYEIESEGGSSPEATPASNEGVINIGELPAEEP